MRKLWHREVKQLAQGRTATEGQSQDWNPDCLDPESMLFTITHAVLLLVVFGVIKITGDLEQTACVS